MLGCESRDMGAACKKGQQEWEWVDYEKFFDIFQTAGSLWRMKCWDPGLDGVLSADLVLFVQDRILYSLLSTCHFLPATVDPLLGTDEHSTNRRPKYVMNQITFCNSVPKNEQWEFLFIRFCSCVFTQHHLPICKFN